MILGTGFDTVDIRRIEASIQKFGARFETRVFTKNEIAKAHKRVAGGRHSPRAATFAKRFAAKEACAKALGTGISFGVSWREIEVVNAASGKPEILLHGRAAALAKSLCPAATLPKLHLSLSDDYPYAYAQVIFEAVPPEKSPSPRGEG